MTAPYRFAIEQFINHFADQAQAIESVDSALHRKLLYCCALDPLARALLGNTGKHRPRIEYLVEHHADWPDANRVSLFQLALTLRHRKRTRYRLFREVRRRLSLMPPRRRQPLADSPLPDELHPFATPDELVWIKLCQYKSLFYTYRNNLIHEFREPGYGTDWSRKAVDPFYTSLSAFGERELVFPLAFIQRLHQSCLRNVEAQLLFDRVNPHTRFDFGSHWRS